MLLRFIRMPVSPVKLGVVEFPFVPGKHLVVLPELGYPDQLVEVDKARVVGVARVDPDLSSKISFFNTPGCLRSGPA